MLFGTGLWGLNSCACTECGHQSTLGFCELMFVYDLAHAKGYYYACNFINTSIHMYITVLECNSPPWLRWDGEAAL